MTEPKNPPVFDEAGYYMKPWQYDGNFLPIMTLEDYGFYPADTEKKPVEIWSFGGREKRDTITVTRHTAGNLAGNAEISGPVVDTIMKSTSSDKALLTRLEASGARLTLDGDRKSPDGISIMCAQDTARDLVPYVALLYLEITTETLNAEMKP